MVRRAVSLVALAAALLLVLAPPAWAHARLVSSDPAPSAVLDRSPERVTLGFDENVEVGLGGIELVGSDGQVIATPPVASVPGDPTKVTAPLPALGDGTYVVVWRVTSADGHPVQGALTFRVGQGTVADTSSLVAGLLAGTKGSGGVGIALGVARFAGYAGVALALGAIAFLAVSWPAGAASWPARRLAWFGAGLALLASVADFVLLGPYATGRAARAVLDTSLWSSVARIRDGEALLLRAVALVALLALLATLRRGVTRVWVASAALVGLVVSVSYALVGHPSTGPLPLIGITAATAHVAAMAVWLGGLAVMALVLLVPPASPVARTVGAAVRDEAPSVEAGEAVEGPADPVGLAVRRFSSLALLAAAVVVVSGVVQAWRILDGFSALTDGPYGRLLLVKVGLVGLVLVAAASARTVVRRRWPDPRGLRRVVGVEVALGVAVLAVTAVLVATSPLPAGGGSFNRSIVQGSTIADLSILPARTGDNELHLLVTVPGGSLQRAKSAEVRMTQPERQIGPIPVPLQTAGPNHWVSPDFQIPFPGRWQVEILVTTADGTVVRLATPLDVP